MVMYDEIKQMLNDYESYLNERAEEWEIEKNVYKVGLFGWRFVGTDILPPLGIMDEQKFLRQEMTLWDKRSVNA